MRSRAVSRPFLCCASAAFAPPPSCSRASSFLISVSKSTMRRVFSSKSAELRRTRLSRSVLMDAALLLCLPCCSPCPLCRCDLCAGDSPPRHIFLRCHPESPRFVRGEDPLFVASVRFLCVLCALCVLCVKFRSEVH